MIDHGLKLCVAVQCQLLDIARSTYYYERQSTESEANLVLMEEIDPIFLAYPENGSRMMTRILRRRGRLVNRKLFATTDAAKRYLFLGPTAIDYQTPSSTCEVSVFVGESAY